MNVYSHWLSPLSFVLILQVTTTTHKTFYPSFRRFYRRYPHFRSYLNIRRKDDERRSGKRPRSAEDGRAMGDDVASGHSRRRTIGRRATAWQAAAVGGGQKDDGRRRGKRPRWPEDDRTTGTTRTTTAARTWLRGTADALCQGGNKVLRTETGCRIQD